MKRTLSTTNVLAPSVLAFAAAAGTLLASRDASALGAEVGGDVGYGLRPFQTDPNAANRFGFGFGAHGGIEISSFYLGASIRYYLGGTDNFPLVAETKYHTLQIGGELGYQISIGPLGIRPYVWAGPTSFYQTVAGVSSSSTRFSFAPAAAARVKLLSPLFIGADVRYSCILGGDGDPFRTELAILGSIGVAF